MVSQKKTRMIFWFVFLISLIGYMGQGKVATVYAESPEDSKSLVRIPWSEFKKFLKIDSDEVILTWEEFKKLLAQTGSEVKVEYNIQNGKVVLQREQFKKLLEQMKVVAVAPIAPPGDYLITKAEYSGIMKKKSVSFTVKFYLEIFEKDRTAFSKIPLLPQNVALQKITLDNKSGLVMMENGWYVLATNKSGQHIIDLEFSIQTDLEKGPDVVNLSVPQTSITLLKIDIPIEDVLVEIPQEKHMTVSRIGGHTKVEAVLSTTNQINVKLHRTLVTKTEKKRGPAKIYAETFSLLSIEDDALRVTTKFKLNILQNIISNIEIFVPADYSILYVKDQNWQEIRDWNTKKVKGKDILSVPFGGAKEGSVIFTVVSERIFSEKQNEIDFDGYQILNAVRETGYIGGEKKSTAETEISVAEKIDRLDIQELPIELVNMSARPPIFGLRYLRHPFRLTLKVTKHEELPVVNTVIDNASVMSVFLEEGKVITRIVYTMRNTGKQFLELKLPEKAEIWSLYVSGKREVPAKNEAGVFMIPLARSQITGENIASFDVEILYYYRTTEFSFLGAKRLQFPKTDIIISRMLWSCYLPDDYRLLHFGGNVEKEQLATGINPFLGRNRVFSYDEVSEYNDALTNWETPEKQVSNRAIKRSQGKLESKFRTSSANQRDAFLNQLKQEIDFAQNIQKEQRKGIITGGEAGIALLKIEVPTSGQLYRFAKTIVEGEELYLDFQYVKGWLNIILKFIVLLVIVYILLLLRKRIIALYIRIKKWSVSQKDFWNKFASPNGIRSIFVVGALIFWFINKFLFVVFVLLFLTACIKPQWFSRHKKQ